MLNIPSSMTGKLFRIAMCSILVAGNFGMVTSNKQDIQVIGKFLTKITPLFPNFISKRITIVSPLSSVKSSFKSYSHGYIRLYQLYKMLSPKSYIVSKNTLNDVEREKKTPSLIVIPFMIYVANVCEFIQRQEINASDDYYLVYRGNSSRQIQEFKNCHLKYESNVYPFVIKDSSIVHVKEVYKIEEDAKNIQQNLLAKYNSTNDTFTLMASVDKWKRRNDLNGITFSAYYIPYLQYVIDEPKSTNEDGNYLSKPTGAFVDIMERLGSLLNFTLDTTMTPRYDYSYLVDATSNGTKDMTIGVFSIVHHRSYHVDFSLSIVSQKFKLFFPLLPYKIPLIKIKSLKPI